MLFVVVPVVVAVVAAAPAAGADGVTDVINSLAECSFAEGNPYARS